MLVFKEYRSFSETVEAIRWEELSDAGEIVNQLIDSGVRHIVVNSFPANPQLEETSFKWYIAFTNLLGIVESFGIGDYLVFTEGGPVAYGAEQFTAIYEEVD